MRKSNDTLLTGDVSPTPGRTNVLGKPLARISTPVDRAPRASWGFTLPVLVVFAALWFLLSGSRFIS